MTQQQAEEQAQIFREFGKDLTQSLQDVMVCGASGRQFSDYRDVIGRLLGSSYFTVLRPVWTRYPDAEPVEMRGRSGEPPPSPPLPIEQCRLIIQLVDRLRDALQAYRELIEQSGDTYYMEAVEADRQEFDDAIAAAREFVRASHPELLEDSTGV